MSTPLPTLLREIHRLRRHLRDLQEELTRLPISLKARHTKVAKAEQTLKEAQDGIKHLKVQLHDKETSLKSTGQQLAKYERQLPDMTTPKEIEAKQTEIANSKATIAKLEEELLSGMSDLDNRVAKVPELEGLVKKAKEEAVAFEAESKERQERLAREKKLAEEELKKTEAQLPPAARGQYDRIIKAHGADALAEVNGRNCSHCRSSVTAQTVHELAKGTFVFCPSCGRALYPAE